MDDLQCKIGEWGERTFPEATADTIMAHLQEEVAELGDAVYRRASDETEEEAADVLLLLLHLAHRFGFSLFDAACVKMARNENRTWAPAEDGYWKHQDAPADPPAPTQEEA